MKSIKYWRDRAESLKKHAEKFKAAGQEDQALEFEEAASDAVMFADEMKAKYSAIQSTRDWKPR